MGSITNAKTLLTNLSTLPHLHTLIFKQITSQTSSITIPEEIGTNLATRLKTLDLSNNTFEAFPEKLGQLTNLENLNLSNTNLTEIPSFIPKLVNLKTLDLSYNKINTINFALFDALKSITKLDLSGNDALSIPLSIFISWDKWEKKLTLENAAMVNSIDAILKRLAKIFGTISLPSETDQELDLSDQSIDNDILQLLFDFPSIAQNLRAILQKIYNPYSNSLYVPEYVNTCKTLLDALDQQEKSSLVSECIAAQEKMFKHTKHLNVSGNKLTSIPSTKILENFSQLESIDLLENATEFTDAPINVNGKTISITHIKQPQMQRNLIILLNHYFDVNNLKPDAIRDQLAIALTQQIAPIVTTGAVLILILFAIQAKNTNALLWENVVSNITNFSALFNQSYNKEQNEFTQGLEQFLHNKIPFDTAWDVYTHDNLYILIPKNDTHKEQVLKGFTELTLVNNIAWNSVFNISQSIPEMEKTKKQLATNLHSLFKPKSGEWVIFMMGHGSPSGDTCGISADDFKAVLNFFAKNIKTKALYYVTCFGGGKHLTDIPQVPFLIGQSAATDAVAFGPHFKVPAFSVDPSKAKKGHDIWDENTKTFNPNPIKPDFFTQNNITISMSFSNFFASAGKDQSTLITHDGIELPSGWVLTPEEQKEAARVSLQVPLVQVPGTNYFEAHSTDPNDFILKFAMLRAHKLSFVKKASSSSNQASINLSAQTIEIQDKKRLFLYPAEVDVPVSITGSMPVIVSMNPDDWTLHIFHDLDCNQFEVGTVLKAFLPLGVENTKLYFIKKLVCSNGTFTDVFIHKKPPAEKSEIFYLQGDAYFLITTDTDGNIESPSKTTEYEKMKTTLLANFLSKKDALTLGTQLAAVWQISRKELNEKVEQLTTPETSEEKPLNALKNKIWDLKNKIESLASVLATIQNKLNAVSTKLQEIK